MGEADDIDAVGQRGGMVRPARRLFPIVGELHIDDLVGALTVGAQRSEVLRIELRVVPPRIGRRDAHPFGFGPRTAGAQHRDAGRK